MGLGDGVPTNDEIYRILVKIERTLNGNGQPGLVQRVTENSAKIESHWHPGMVEEIAKARMSIARWGGIGFGVFTVLNLVIVAASRGWHL